MSSTKRALHALIVLLAAMLVGGVPAATADETNGVAFDAGVGDWGVKESFRNYITGPIAHGSATVGDGAIENADGTYGFPVVGGSYDGATGEAEIMMEGSVHFQGHEMPAGSGDFALDMKISNPVVSISGDSGTLTLDAVSKDMASGEFANYPDIVFADLDLTGIAPAVTEETVGWTAIPATLTAAGSPAFAGFYPAGTVLDPITINAEIGIPSEPGPDPSPGPKPEPKPDPDPAPKPDLGRAAGATFLGKAKVVTKPRRKAVRIGKVRCGEQSCEVKTRKKARLKVSKKRKITGKVLAPKSLAAGQTAPVKLKLRKRALGKINKKAKGRIKITIVSDGERIKRRLKVTLKR